MEQLFLGKLYFAFFLRKIGLGDLEAARQYLMQMLRLAPSLLERQEELMHLIMFWMRKQPPEIRLALVQRALESLPGDSVNSRLFQRRVLGEMYISQAFSEHMDGHGAQTRQYLIKGLRCDPSYLKNRGVISIFARSFLNKPAFKLEATNHKSVSLQSVISSVEAAIGCTVDKASRITKGLSGNKLYLIEANGQSYVLRLVGKDILKQTISLAKQVRVEGVPTPDIIASTPLAGIDSEHTWLLEEWSPGSWFDPSKMSVADELVITAELGLYLRRVHKIKTMGFGPISSAQLDVPYPNFETWLDLRQQTIEEGCIMGAIPASTLSALAAADRLLRESFAGPPVLCHGDLGRGNILIEAGHIRSIIDWGDALGSDPAYDIAVFFGSMRIYWDPQKMKATLPIFLQAYGNEADDFYRRVIAHQLLFAAHEAAWSVDEGENEYFSAYQSILADVDLFNQQAAVDMFLPASA